MLGGALLRGIECTLPIAGHVLQAVPLKNTLNYSQRCAACSFFVAASHCPFCACSFQTTAADRLAREVEQGPDTQNRFLSMRDQATQSCGATPLAPAWPGAGALAWGAGGKGIYLVRCCIYIAGSSSAHLVGSRALLVRHCACKRRRPAWLSGQPGSPRGGVACTHHRQTFQQRHHGLHSAHGGARTGHSQWSRGMVNRIVVGTVNGVARTRLMEYRRALSMELRHGQWSRSRRGQWSCGLRFTWGGWWSGLELLGFLVAKPWLATHSEASKNKSTKARCAPSPGTAAPRRTCSRQLPSTACFGQHPAGLGLGNCCVPTTARDGSHANSIYLKARAGWLACRLHILES